MHVHAHFPRLVRVARGRAGSARGLAVPGAEALRRAHARPRKARAQRAGPRRVEARAQSRSRPAGPVHG